jgi:hypothetical protein
MSPLKRHGHAQPVKENQQRFTKLVLGGEGKVVFLPLIPDENYYFVCNGVAYGQIQVSRVCCPGNQTTLFGCLGDKREMTLSLI